MIKLRLCKGLSYSGVVAATKKEPFVDVEDQKIADQAISTGYFELVSIGEDKIPEETNKEPENEPGGAQEAQSEDQEPKRKSLHDMTKAEIEEYAAEIGADVSSCANQKERIEVVKAILANQETADQGENEETTPDFNQEV